MKGYVFDPSRLRGTVKQQEDTGYAVVADMLRERLAGDPLAEVRRRFRSDPEFHALLDDLRAASEEATDALAAELQRRG